MQTDVYIHAHWNKYSEKFNYEVFNQDMTEYGYVLIEKRTLDFETPEEKQLRIRAADALAAKLQKMRAEHYAEEQELETERKELLALEFKEETRDA